MISFEDLEKSYKWKEETRTDEHDGNLSGYYSTHPETVDTLELSIADLTKVDQKTPA